jgi:hypothetical protein
MELRKIIEDSSARISAAFDQVVVSETAIDGYRPDD